MTHPILNARSNNDCAMRVLVVEDERKLGELLRRGLDEEGYAADLADRGEEALWMAQAVPYDAIVLDVMLPGADGFEICRRIRAKSDVPVLMLTARGDDLDRIVGLELGADAYLPKPFNPPPCSRKNATIGSAMKNRPALRPLAGSRGISNGKSNIAARMKVRLTRQRSASG